MSGFDQAKQYFAGAATVSWVTGGAATDSSELDVRGYSKGAFKLPATEFDTNTISFKASKESGGTFVAIHGKTGSLISLTAPTGPVWVDFPPEVFAHGFIKIVTGTATGDAAVAEVVLKT